MSSSAVMSVGDWAFFAATSFCMASALSRMVCATGVQLASSLAVIWSLVCRLVMRCSTVSEAAVALMAAGGVVAAWAKAALEKAVPPSSVAPRTAGRMRARANVVAMGRVMLIMGFAFLGE